MNETEKKVIANMLDEIIRNAAPQSQTVPKYGGVLYTIRPDEKEGQFCGIFIQKNHVNLSFANGSSLADPTGVLLGGGKYRRHINYHSADDVDSNVLMPLLKQSAKLSLS